VVTILGEKMVGVLLQVRFVEVLVDGIICAIHAHQLKKSQTRWPFKDVICQKQGLQRHLRRLDQDQQ